MAGPVSTPPPDFRAIVHRPGPALSPFVRRIVCYRMPPVEIVHRGLPSPVVTVVFGIDGPLTVGWDPDRSSSGRYDALASGMHSAPAYIFPGPGIEGVQLDVTPAGARALFGAPAAALHADVVELSDLCGGVGRLLTERVVTSVSWSTRPAVVESALLDIVRPHLGMRSEVAWAWRRIVGGQQRIDGLADEIGWSRGYFARQFAAEFGVLPKETARIVRFDRARRALQQATGGARRASCGSLLADTAATFGYADQAHLTREWRRLAGIPPTQWLDEEFTFVQDPAASAARR